MILGMMHRAMPRIGIWHYSWVEKKEGDQRWVPLGSQDCRCGERALLAGNDKDTMGFSKLSSCLWLGLDLLNWILLLKNKILIIWRFNLKIFILIELFYFLLKQFEFFHKPILIYTHYIEPNRTSSFRTENLVLFLLAKIPMNVFEVWLSTPK